MCYLSSHIQQKFWQSCGYADVSFFEASSLFVVLVEFLFLLGPLQTQIKAALQCVRNAPGKFEWFLYSLFEHICISRQPAGVTFARTTVNLNRVGKPLSCLPLSILVLLIDIFVCTIFDCKKCLFVTYDCTKNSGKTNKFVKHHHNHCLHIRHIKL